MSVYPGNPSLSAAVKDRVASTFQQTLALYQQGRTDEVVQGCSLILQMDPLFDPARKLLEKARNPTSPVDVSAFAGGPAAGATIDDARAAMQSRDFERVVQITTDLLTSDLMNDEARQLSDQAREKMEAAPFIDQFVRKCEQHLADNNLPAARGDVEKARALDPTHPAITQMEKLIAKKDSAPSAFDASSFVVDTPAPPTGRGTAQATDFGFTFEEEKPQQSPGFANFSFDSAPTPSSDAPFAGGFSFDAPLTSAPAAPAGGAGKASASFDFSTASIETSPEDQKKIDQYLSDGDRAFDAANYQEAIDLWSRIFLIDVTNEAASERIERAKGKRREIEQKLDSVIAAGVAAFEKKDYITARARFNEVLQADPANVTARDYLEQIDAGGPVAPTTSDSSFSSVLDDNMSSAFEDRMGDTDAEPVAAPIPARKPAAKAAAAPVKKKKPMGMVAAVIGVVVLAIAGYFGWSMFSSKEETAVSTSSGVISRASSLGLQGRYDEAIAMLRDIKPGDTQYDAALAMIADLQQKKSRAASTIDGRPAAEYYDENLAAGQTAFAAHDYIEAKKAFENAMRVKPLPPDAKSAYDTAAQQVAKLGAAKTLFTEGKYQDALLALQALQQQEPDNRSIQRMILDAHFNIGAKALRDERLADATAAFDHVLKVDPNDELAKRSRALAERYEGQPRDLLYKIYVKYLPLRQPAI